MVDIAAAAGAADSIGVQRKLRALQTDLAHDSHECDVGRRRAVQTECEQRYLSPALREAAESMSRRPDSQGGMPGPDSVVEAARIRIQHYLGQLETLYPTL